MTDPPAGAAPQLWPVGPVVVQRGTPAQWQTVRKFRVHAVSAEPDSFGTSVEQEATRDEAEWRTSLTTNAWLVAGSRPGPRDQRALEDLVVGIVGLFWTDRYPDGAPQLGAMWVDPRHRGSGVAARLGYRHTGACTAAPKDPDIAMRRMRHDLRSATPRVPPDAETRLLPPPAHP